MDCYEKAYHDREISKKELGDMCTVLEGIIGRKDNESSLCSYLEKKGLSLLGFSEKIGKVSTIASMLIKIFKDDADFEKGMRKNITRAYIRMNRVYKRMDGDSYEEDRYILCRANIGVLVIEEVEIPEYFVETAFMKQDGRWIVAK